MSVWTWVLIGLGVAGALLAAVSVVAVALEALRVRARVRELQNSRLFMSLESMQIQSTRLSRTAAQMPPLVARAQAALAQIRTAGNQAAMPQARAALEQSGAEISTLLDALR